MSSRRLPGAGFDTPELDLQAPSLDLSLWGWICSLQGGFAASRVDLEPPCTPLSLFRRCQAQKLPVCPKVALSRSQQLPVRPPNNSSAPYDDCWPHIATLPHMAVGLALQRTIASLTRGGCTENHNNVSSCCGYPYARASNPALTCLPDVTYVRPKSPQAPSSAASGSGRLL